MTFNLLEYRKMTPNKAAAADGGRPGLWLSLRVFMVWGRRVAAEQQR